MKQLIEFPMEDEGGSIWVEVEGPEPEVGVEPAMRGITPAARGGEYFAKAEQTFQKAIARIKPAAQAIIDQLRGIASPPDQIGVEFGFKLSAKAGVVIASTDAEANFKVTLTWNRTDG